MNTSCVKYSKTASAHRQIHVHQTFHVNTNKKHNYKYEYAYNTIIRHIHTLTNILAE